jgi:hypothetical protein
VWSFQSLFLAIGNRVPEPNRRGSPLELTQQAIIYGDVVTSGFFRQSGVGSVRRLQTLVEQTHCATLSLIQIKDGIGSDLRDQRLHMLAPCQVRVGRNLGTMRWRYDRNEIRRPNIAQNQLNCIRFRPDAHLVLIV